MFLASALVALLPVAQHALPADGPRIHPQRLLIRVDPRFQELEVERLLGTIHARQLWNLPQIGWRAIEVEP